LQDRARLVADAIGWTSFRASSGWCVKFLRRNNIKLRQLKKRALLKANCKESTGWEEKILRGEGGSSSSGSSKRKSQHRLLDDGETYTEEDGDEEGNSHQRGENGDSGPDSDSEGDDDMFGGGGSGSRDRRGYGHHSKDKSSSSGAGKVPTLEGARKAWSSLQEWFIANPPYQDRVMQAIFIINKEMMNPTTVPPTVVSVSSGAMSSSSSSSSSSSNVPTNSAAAVDVVDTQLGTGFAAGANQQPSSVAVAGELEAGETPALELASVGAAVAAASGSVSASLPVQHMQGNKVVKNMAPRKALPTPISANSK
jgi:hypothetical protein